MHSATVSSDSLAPTLVNEDTTGPVESTESSGSDHETEIGDEDDEYDDDIIYGDYSDEEDPETQALHDDHSDTIFFQNPWMDEWCTDFRNTWLFRGKDSVTNEELYQNPTTQAWMKGLASLRQNRISLLILGPRSGKCWVPLFQDGNGWEYQLALEISHFSLPKIACPSVLGEHQLASSALFKLERRIQTESDPAVGEVPTPPRLAVNLGTLQVKNDTRGGVYHRIGETATELTDYRLIVDVEHEDMPVWLLAPRVQLQKRLDNPFHPGTPVLPLPIFDGLMLKEDDCGYDCACILPSVRSIGRRPPDLDAPNFQDACELVRKTRAIVDPAALLLPEERALDFMGGVPLSNTYISMPYSKLEMKQEEAKQEEAKQEEAKQEGAQTSAHE